MNTNYEMNTHYKSHSISLKIKLYLLSEDKSSFLQFLVDSYDSILAIGTDSEETSKRYAHCIFDSGLVELLSIGF